MSEQPDPLFIGVPDDNLRFAAEGCTELTCLYHGRINAELRRRAITRDETGDDS